MLDVRAALRSLRRSPIFAATAMLTLAGGIGGTTIVFSIVRAVLVRPLPFAHPDRLVRMWETKPGDGASRVGVSTPDFFDWRDRATAFDGMALFGGDQVLTVLDTPAGSLQVADVDVTANLFAVLGVRPLIGRGFSVEPTAPRAVILSERLWRAAFDADPTVVDRTVRVEAGMVLPVAGVVPDGAGFPLSADLWITAPESLLRSLARDDRFFGGAVGRLRDGVSVATAQTDLVRVARDLAREYPTTNAGWSVTVDPLDESIVGQYRVALLMLFGAVAFVLLVGCANIAGLMLARGVSTQRELAVRAALGASRARLVRQLLTESLALALAGGVAGGLLTVVGLPIVARVAGPMMPIGCLALICLIAGYIPVRTAGQTDAAEALKTE
jgi:putative ABC transport system permease protein